MIHRLARFLPRLPDRHTLTCAVALLSFVGGSVGLPLEPLGSAHSGCCCGQVLQASGSCCCAKAKSVSPASAPRSCCAKSKSESDQPNRDSDSSNDEPVTASLCSCSGSVALGLLINTEPRVLPLAIDLKHDDSERTVLSLVAPSLSSISLDLETPPPKLPAALIS